MVLGERNWESWIFFNIDRFILYLYNVKEWFFFIEELEFFNLVGY